MGGRVGVGVGVGVAAGPISTFPIYTEGTPFIIISQEIFYACYSREWVFSDDTRKEVKKYPREQAFYVILYGNSGLDTYLYLPYVNWRDSSHYSYSSLRRLIQNVMSLPSSMRNALKPDAAFAFASSSFVVTW